MPCVLTLEMSLTMFSQNWLVGSQFQYFGAVTLNFACGTFGMQKDNNGIVMVNFYPDFINCTNPDNATLKEVAGIFRFYT